ncbi:TetR family transcriptional regulator [Antricoccus suffuscus]|uniref:TetR family transcriptional regulator n=2 Tax=Antricoccus suffuscus TaxID=1629062 RepID=A0A2T1A3E8_9ACTN|nr:TetR family transcriptional regulator [Antricoccus suffuscus]
MFQNGICQTGLDQVLEHSGAGKSQLYHYFGGKQDLVAAVIKTQLERVLSTEPSLDSIHRWSDLQAWHAAFVERHGTDAGPIACRLGKFAGELDHDDVLRAALADAFEQWRGQFAAVMVRLRESGDLRVDADPDDLASALLSAIQGGLLLGRLHRDAHFVRISMDIGLAYVRSHLAVRV